MTSLSMHHPQLGSKGKAIRAQIDKLILHVITCRQVQHQSGSYDGLDICLSPVGSEFLTLQGRRSVKVNGKSND